jgi:putative phage-type endonuclease
MIMDKQWHDARAKGIGGSDVGAVCGVNPYKTPLQVWEAKRGLSDPQEDNPAMFWGRTLEPVIRQKYSDETGRQVLIPDGILTHPGYPWMLGNLDGVTPDNRVVEIKTAGYPTGWGEPGTDEVPMPYLFQCQFYLILTGYAVADIPVLIGGRDFRIYEVPADAELQEMIIERCREFWDLVQSGIPPAPVNYADIQRLYRRSEAKQITSTEVVEQWLRGLRKIQDDIRALEVTEQDVRGWIMEFMKECDELTDLTGKTLATWKNSKGRNRFDIKELRRLQPEVYNQYLIEGEPSRRFLLKKENKND